jgi:hypothetical protein
MLTFYACILNGAGVFPSTLSLRRGRVYDYGLLNGRENMDTQFVRMPRNAPLKAIFLAIASCEGAY